MENRLPLGGKVARPQAVTDEGASTGNSPENRPLIPPSVRTGVPSPQGEGGGGLSMRRPIHSALFVVVTVVRAAGGGGPYGGNCHRAPFTRPPAVGLPPFPSAVSRPPLFLFSPYNSLFLPALQGRL